MYTSLLGILYGRVCSLCVVLCYGMSLGGINLWAEDVVQVNEGTVLARVNGEAITLRSLEDDLMRQEGAQIIEDLLRMQLEGVDWQAFKDEDIIVKVANIEVPRVLLVNQLLEKHGADVREQMIQALIVKQALAKDGIKLDKQLKQDMLERMERKHRLDQEAKGTGTVVPFESAIQDKYGKSLEEWTNDPAFLTLAGLYALLYQRTQIEEDALRAFFKEHQIRYAKPEAYEIAARPFVFVDRNGRVANEQERANIQRLAESTYQLVKNKKRSFAAIVRMFDPQQLGVRGFVGRDGKVFLQGVPNVPVEVMDVVFRHQYDSFPTVLGPIHSPDAVSIVEVRSYRPAEKPDFEAHRTVVKRDLIDEDVDAYMSSFLRELKGASQIDYTGMLPVMQERRKDLKGYLEQRQQQAVEQRSDSPQQAPEAASEQ